MQLQQRDGRTLNQPSSLGKGRHRGGAESRGRRQGPGVGGSWAVPCCTRKAETAQKSRALQL